MDHSSFTSSQKSFEVYTDGSHSQKRGGYAFIVVSKDRVIHKFVSNSENETTNNIMELKAILAAFEFVEEKGYERVTVKSDSEYSVKSITLWKLNKKKKNHDLIHKCIECYKRLRKQGVELKWIRGHQKTGKDSFYNAIVDELANKARLQV